MAYRIKKVTLNNGDEEFSIEESLLWGLLWFTRNSSVKTEESGRSLIKFYESQDVDKVEII